MPKNIKIPEPEKNLKFIDVHCHLGGIPRPKNDQLPSDEVQIRDFFERGGLYLITCSIDMSTLKLILDFISDNKNIGFTCGWAPQTVTYTPKDKYVKEWQEWVNYIESNQEDYLAIGEIGLDFHHAKTLEKRKKQVRVFRKILELTKDFDKPYVLHVRNAAHHEYDRENPKHRYNKKNGANEEIFRILGEFNINPRRVLWHCFSGPEDYGIILPKQGFMISVPSSAYGYDRWRKVSKHVPLQSLVTETDSYYQHPYLRGPLNVPSNVRYAIAAISYSQNISQEIVSKKTIENAKRFFKLSIG